MQQGHACGSALPQLPPGELDRTANNPVGTEPTGVDEAQTMRCFGCGARFATHF